MRHYNIPIFIPHLGCPFNCIFCNQKNIARHEPAPEPSAVPIMVQRALETIPAAAGLEKEVEVAYFGGSFTALDKRLQEHYLWDLQSFLDAGSIDGIRISTRPDFIDHSILRFLLENGVKTIELGVQSLKDEVLESSGRGYTAQTVVNACTMIKEYGFKLGVQLMIGLPGDNYENDMETTIGTVSIAPDMVRIYPVLVIKDTGLEKLYLQGRYTPMGLEEAVSICCEMFLRFQQKGIEVIRMGLHPAEELREEGVVIAGPFHPAFGELVEQEAFKKQARVLLDNYISEKNLYSEVKLYSSYRDLSKMIGQKRTNLSYLNLLDGLPVIKRVQVDEQLRKDELGIGPAGSEEPESKLSRTRFLEIYFQ
ncbi:oxygen-independent coproporphyrinogen iii oxidase [hydrocarbon metagenome]|uniref:Oxygen-independent coproporphyrinogen iii oxidase n=1 Tax=hydrocarbon metagenome TaxID=938273 RepID=A0A0W8E419_9ZZZZ